MYKTTSVITGTLLLLSITTGAYADSARTFKKKCGACHSITVNGETIGKPAMGPDLTGISSKRPEGFVRMYIIDPNGARKKYSDVYQNEIKGKYKMKMPPVKLSDDVLDELVDFMK